ncbi:hypothetical protein [Fusibacter ferrireducens]|uniref:Uncharacterized protein n=1 Tax=Fusibacter ferrireducens TaxID=2785058 RepID=A0ABR9ZTM2_9FIRM|nr:hypothetical protein [Fusibacter ferrireducens]MBF4693834.1 hypothetical protein [Fusibacter ferrireducens]
MNPRVKKIVNGMIVLLTVSMILKVSYELKWIDILLGILKVETKDKKVQKISFKALSFVAKADHEIDFLIEMKSMGWHFLKHYGRGMIFEKEGYEILISKRTYFNKYAFYEVTTKEIFDVI